MADDVAQTDTNTKSIATFAEILAESMREQRIQTEIDVSSDVEACHSSTGLSGYLKVVIVINYKNSCLPFPKQSKSFVMLRRCLRQSCRV